MCNNTDTNTSGGYTGTNGYMGKDGRFKEVYGTFGSIKKPDCYKPKCYACAYRYTCANYSEEGYTGITWTYSSSDGGNIKWTVG